MTGGPSPLELFDGMESVQRRFRLTIIGDVRLEFRGRLPRQRFADIGADEFITAPVDALVAGTAVNFARHARECFRTVHVVAKIGDDRFTPLIQQEIRELGLGGHLWVQPGAANGLLLMLRDATGDAGVRLMVASEAAPLGCLTPADIEASTASLAGADVVFLDGYALLAAQSRAAALTAMRLGHSYGARIAFDLVPHDIYRRAGLAEVLPALALADLVVAEASTLARLLGLDQLADSVVEGDSAGLDQLLAVAEEATAVAEATAGAKLWLIRHGPGGMDDVLAYQRGQLRLAYQTGYRQAGQKAGFGDRVAARELYWWLARQREPAIGEGS